MRTEGSTGRPLRVMHVADFVNRHDFIDHIVRFLDRRRFFPMVATFTRATNISDPCYADAGIPHFVIPRARRVASPIVAWKLAALLRRERVDVLCTHHYEAAIIGAAAAIAARVPLVVGRHYDDEIYLLTKGTKRAALLALERVAHTVASRIVVPTQKIRDLLVERQGVPAAKIAVVPYAFDFTSPAYRAPDAERLVALRRELALGEEFLVGNFGRHHPTKGQPYLLRAFAAFVRRHPNARLLMVGTGQETEALKALAVTLGVADRVIFTGWRRDARALMCLVDVVVHPTLHEAFPQLMVEVMALGRPLVITPVSGPSEQVEDGRTGFLVPLRDADAIAAALEAIVRDPERARQIAQRGRDHVRGTLRVEQVVPRHEALYEELVRARP